MSDEREYSRSRESESVARRIEEAAEDDSWELVEELLGKTDCAHGCYVEPDGVCAHGNEPLVLVLGLPAYYRRFGFQRAPAFGIAPPDGIPDDAWMAVTLSSYSPALRGKVIWPPAFSGVP